MGGIIIIIGTLVPVILMSNLENIYTDSYYINFNSGTIGLIDDYIKVFKKDKKGLHGKFKIAGQSLLGIFVGIVLLTNNDITIVEFGKNLNSNNIELSQIEEVKSYKTTIPFFKNNELDYNEVSEAIFGDKSKYLWLIIIPIIILL